MRVVRLSLPIALLVFVWLLWPAVAHAQSWYNPSWSYRKSILILQPKVGSGGPHLNFPVLINLASDAALAPHAQASGNDILFTASDGTTKLDHEIESYTSGTGALVAWVRVPSLSSSANTVIYMYYGNAAAASQQNKTGVWDANYVAVWHLNETGQRHGGEFKDATVNANNAQGGGGTAAKTPARVAAKIAGGQNFDNVDDYITAPHSASLNLNLNVTLSAWVNMRTFGTGNDTDTIVGKHDESGTPWAAHYKLALHDATGGSALPKVALYKDGTDDTATAAGATGVTANTWHYVVATFAGNTAGNAARVYLDGVQDGTGSLNTVIFTSSWPVSIGGRVTSGAPAPSDLVDGIIDEVRISNSVRSAGWILTEYNNQNSPSTFYTLGAEFTLPSASLSTVVASPTSVPADGTTTSTITVTLKNAAANAVAGKTVTLAQGAGSSTISAASGASDVNGVVTFTVKNSTAQSVTYTATDTTDSVTITQTATVAFTASVASFNVVEPAANAVTGKIFTKIAGQNFALDIVALKADNTIATTFTGTVVVEVVDNTSGGACSGLPLIATLTSQTFAGGDSGRHPLTSPNTVANVYPNAKVRVTLSSPTVISCSADNFAIRPASLSFAVTDANRTTAGTTNTLSNTAIAGATVHNAGRPFTITATAFNGAGTPRSDLELQRQPYSGAQRLRRHRVHGDDRHAERRRLERERRHGDDHDGHVRRCRRIHAPVAGRDVRHRHQRRRQRRHFRGTVHDFVDRCRRGAVCSRPLSRVGHVDHSAQRQCSVLRFELHLHGRAHGRELHADGGQVSERDDGAVYRHPGAARVDDPLVIQLRRDRQRGPDGTRFAARYLARFVRYLE